MRQLSTDVDQPPEPPRRRLSPSARRDQLLAVALDVFTQRGYQGTSLEDIAAAAGVTRPLLYRYFEDKDELYLDLVRTARSALNQVLIGDVATVVGEGGGAYEQLRAGMRAYFSFVRERGVQWDLLFGPGHAVAGVVAEVTRELRFETADKIAALIAAAVPSLDESNSFAYAHAVSGAGEQLAVWWRRNPGLSIDEIVQRHLDVVWSGLQQHVR